MILELAATVALAVAPLHCQHATIDENSGNGPNYRVVICTALKPLEDQRWNLIVDGGPLENGAIIIGERVPA